MSKKEKRENEYQEFTMETTINISHENTTEKVELEDKKTIYNKTKTVKHAVAIIGDRFMKGKFLPAIELEKAHNAWEGTFHDINHMGTNHPMGLEVRSDISQFVGYQKNVVYDEETKSVSMDIHIIENTLHADTWKGYVNLCEKAGRIPNVSVAFLAKVGKMKASELPESVDYAQYGLEKDDVIEYIYDIQPRALSTVLQGACNDKEGCGILPEVKSDKSNSTISDEEYKKEKQKIIDYLRKEEIK